MFLTKQIRSYLSSILENFKYASWLSGWSATLYLGGMIWLTLAYLCPPPPLRPQSLLPVEFFGLAPLRSVALPQCLSCLWAFAHAVLLRLPFPTPFAHACSFWNLSSAIIPLESSPASLRPLFPLRVLQNAWQKASLVTQIWGITSLWNL